jgi:hypothetical protein
VDDVLGTATIAASGGTVHHHPRRALLVGAALTLTLFGVAPAHAQSEDPAGNNGTVKVSGDDMDLIPDNEPHQSCEWDVEFFGFDAGMLYATATFEVIAPSGEALVLHDHVYIGEDAASGAGTSTGRDAERHYDLNEYLWSYVRPVGEDVLNPEGDQGVHVRLTVRAEGSQGDDTKHKVFWATGCEQPPT